LKKTQPTPEPIPPTFQPITSTGVIIYGDWPDTGRCDFTLTANPQRQGTVGAGCNDTATAVYVPFGMSVELCEHDGQSPAGLGKCRRFLPGTTNVGSDMNDKASSFLVEPSMFGYLNSVDFDSGFGPITFGVSAGDDGVHATGGISLQGNSTINMDYNIPLPAKCLQPTVRETTKANDATWGSQIKNGVLHVGLSIKTKGLFGPNNWVGVEIKCL